MREESHLEEMRAAIRGDFARLAERRQEPAVLLPTDERPGVSESASAEASVPSPSPEEPEPEVRRSWLDRLLSR